MMILTTRLTKKRAVCSVLLFGAIMAALILLMCRGGGKSGGQPTLPDNTARVDYLTSLGWAVCPEPVETLQFLLPDPLTQPYLSYNQLQTPQGFDLEPYAGKQVERCTYTVKNYPGKPAGVQLNLYLCESQPIAGDVCCPGKDGFQQSLQFPKQSA